MGFLLAKRGYRAARVAAIYRLDTIPHRMSCHPWDVDAAAALRTLEALHPGVPSKLLYSTVDAVDSLDYLHALDAHTCSPAPNEARYGHSPYCVDMAHARWAATTAITALDLCAAILGRIGLNPQGRNGGEFSLPQAAAQRATLPQPAQNWIVAVERDARYAPLRQLIRNPLVHGPTPDRTMFLSNTLLVARTRIDGASLDAGQIVRNARDLAHAHVETFLTGILAGTLP